MENLREEICLVANIIEKLLDLNATLRADQLLPLTKRLRSAADAISAAEGATPTSAAALFPSPKVTRNVDASAKMIKSTGSRNMKKAQDSFGKARCSPRRKEGSPKQCVTASNDKPETPYLHVSNEVSESLCCSLYNILEGAVNLLRASHGHIFVKSGDDMLSIANVSKKLVFPPQQVHHRCMGNADAEVLGSSIALNRFTDDVGKKSSLLIFPVFGRDRSSLQSRVPVATIHVERKEHMFEPFNYSDECILHFASMLCGELMSRIPHFSWLDSFYDPVTQHIVAPFAPYKPVTLPGIRRMPVASPHSSMSPNTVCDALLVSQLAHKIDAHDTEVLIRRETLPSTNSKPFAPGVTHMPSLLEIQVYVDNLQSCWGKNMTGNLDLLEANRCAQQELKVVRSELHTLRRQLTEAKEKLRLYELESRDYKYEYGALKSELNTYMDKLERLN